MQEKPCPFCGCEKVRVFPIGKNFTVSCGNWDCVTDGPIKETIEEAIKAWNTRVPLTEARGT